MIEFVKDDYFVPFEAKTKVAYNLFLLGLLEKKPQVYKFGIYITFRVAIVTENGRLNRLYVGKRSFWINLDTSRNTVFKS